MSSNSPSLAEIREAYSKFSDEYGKVILSKIHMEELDDLEAKLVARAERLEARVKELEAEIKLWHDTLDGTVHTTCHVMRLMEKIIKESNDE